MLQNLDLDTVTFAQIASTGDPISIEDMNEQEMVDLIIVNLARLCVAGEWDGLLEAGASSAVVLAATPNTDWAAANRYQELGNCQPFGGGTSYAYTSDFGYNQAPNFMPFIAAQAGALTSMSLVSNSTATSSNFRVGVYDVNDDGNPGALLGYCDFDTAAGSGTLTVTSFSQTITTVRGSIYWLGYVKTTDTSSISMRGYAAEFGAIGEVSTIVANYHNCFFNNTGSSTGALADPADISTWTPRYLRRLALSLTW